MFAKCSFYDFYCGQSRAIVVADKIISPVQTAFVRNMFILDDVLLLREIIHEIRVKKRSAVNFKLDFKKGQN